MIAAIIRQYFRALEANDSEAVELESVDLCSATSWLLEEHLKCAPDWDSEQRWLDGVIDSNVVDLAKLCVQIEGKVVWGLSEDPGGKQWSEPLWARMHASDEGLEQYEIRFGHANEEESSEVEFGFYQTISSNRVKSEVPDRRVFKFAFSGGLQRR